MNMNLPKTPFYPGRAAIDAYGNGGFRFAEMSHRGSLLILGDGIHGWDVGDVSAVDRTSFNVLFAAPEGIEFILFGTGAVQVFPPSDLRQAFETAGIGLEIMSTGAACRTFNILLAEQRAVGAALIAVA